MSNNYQEPQHGFSPLDPSQVPLEAKVSSKATPSLILGILSLITLPFGSILFLGIVGFSSGIVAIVLSSLSLKEIKRTRLRGRGMAIAGLVCGIVATTLNVFAFVISFLISFMYAFNNA